MAYEAGEVMKGQAMKYFVISNQDNKNHSKFFQPDRMEHRDEELERGGN